MANETVARTSDNDGIDALANVTESREAKVTGERRPKIVFAGVGKHYGAPGRDQVVALEHIDLEIGESEIVSIVGPTGCGKSTSLNLIAGFEQPSSGSLSLDGGPIQRPGPDRAVVFQQAALFPWMHVLDNVALALKAASVAKREYEERARTLLEAVGLTGFERAYPYQLSGGMQQRVQIARALVGNPRILLMDEPFGALDFQTRMVMQELLLDLWRQFRPTIVFITHDVSEAIFISDRVAVMTRRPGRIKKVVDVQVPKPRSYEFLTAPEFAAIEHEVLKAVREEVTVSPRRNGGGEQ
jgi:ABC-type nitrate/sulfonate/bicarbonate transport system ATPase subunit